MASLLKHHGKERGLRILVASLIVGISTGLAAASGEASAVPSHIAAISGASSSGTAVSPAVTSTIPGDVAVESTLECIGIKWFIAGDENLNCSVAVGYRTANSGAAWRQAQPLLRVEPGSYSSYGIDPGNLLAGSILDLIPNTDYEVKLTLSDPDGGSATRSLTVRTRTYPGQPANPRYLHVIPGAGGGSGTLADPFKGLNAANAAAQPGDVIMIGPGTYTGVATLTASGTETNPIVWHGQSVASVILDGQGTAKPIVDLPGTRYVHIENVTITHPKQMGIRASATVGIAIQNCIIDSSQPTPGYEMEGIYFLEPGDRDAFISGNKIIGPFDWAGGRGADGYGIVIGGTGHVIRCNEIYNWWDGVDVGKSNPAIVTEGCDVYRNEIYSCTDDGIETDGSRHNIRVFENRITNVLCGVSCQPVFGGPVCIVRNVVYNWQLKPLKFHEWATGMLVFNNTFVGADPRGWGGGEWRNLRARNNIFIGGSDAGYSGDPICLSTVGVRADMDYDGWYQAFPTRFADFGGTFYTDIGAFRAGTGMETHGILLDIASFVDAEEPLLGSYLGEQGYPSPYLPGSQDLRLEAGSPAVDSGSIVDNVTDTYAGAAPDLGAYELGTATPGYGPTAGVTAEEELAAPEIVRSILAAAPNPFTESTILRCELPVGSAIRVAVFDVEGRLIRTLLDSPWEDAGTRSVLWDGRDEAGRMTKAGAYYCRIESSADRGGITLLKIR